MSYNQFISIFKEYEFLKSLFDRSLVHTRVWKSGEFLCRTGEDMDFLYFISGGRGKVYTSLINGKEVMYKVYEKGMIAGDVEFILGNKTTCNIISTDSLSAWVIPVDLLFKDQYKKLYEYLSRSVALKFITSSRQQAIRLGYTIEERLSYYLLHEYKKEIFSMEELALNLGSTYRHLSRLLKKLTSSGVIKLNRKRVEIIDRSYLEDLSIDITEEFL